MNKPSHIKVTHMLDSIVYKLSFVAAVANLIFEIVSKHQG